MVAVSGHRYTHSQTDTQKAWKHFPFLEVDDLKSIIPRGSTPVAIELLDDAVLLPSYTHPERAFYIFGGEDRTLGDDVLEWCQDRVKVPTAFCLNLAMAVNVVLYDRLAKEMR